MRAKTDANMAAADFLIVHAEGAHCNASIHCSYYAVLQYMKYLLHNLKDMAIDYAHQKKDDVGSHDYLYGEILKRFNGTKNEEKKYKEYFRSLRNFRQKADYTLETFSTDECFICYSMAQGLITLLRNNFKNKIA